MDRLPGTVAPASLVASPSYARAVLPAARAVLHSIVFSPFYRRFSPPISTLPLTLIRTEAAIDNFREGGLKGSIFSRRKKIECRRRQEFKIDGGSLAPRRPNGAAHPCASHPRACRPHKSCTHHVCASDASRLSTTLFRTTTPRSREAPYALSDHTHVRTPHTSLTFGPIRRCFSHT